MQILPHPALGQDLTPSPTTGPAHAGQTYEPEIPVEVREWIRLELQAICRVDREDTGIGARPCRPQRDDLKEIGKIEVAALRDGSIGLMVPARPSHPQRQKPYHPSKAPFPGPTPMPLSPPSATKPVIQSTQALPACRTEIDVCVCRGEHPIFPQALGWRGSSLRTRDGVRSGVPHPPWRKPVEGSASTLDCRFRPRLLALFR